MSTKTAKKGGRPRSGDPTIVTSVRIPTSVLDRYCRQAVVSGKDVRTLLRLVLTMYAPPAWPGPPP
jgi:hypothetical protein